MLKPAKLATVAFMAVLAIAACSTGKAERDGTSVSSGDPYPSAGPDARWLDERLSNMAEAPELPSDLPGTVAEYLNLYMPGALTKQLISRPPVRRTILGCDAVLYGPATATTKKGPKLAWLGYVSCPEAVGGTRIDLYLHQRAGGGWKKIFKHPGKQTAPYGVMLVDQPSCKKGPGATIRAQMHAEVANGGREVTERVTSKPVKSDCLPGNSG